MKKHLKIFLIFILVILIGTGVSSYYLGSDIFNIESVINFIDNEKSTSALKIDDTKYNADGGFYYSSLNGKEKDVYDKIYSRAKNQNTTIKIHSDLDSDRILEIASFVENEHPELFWLTGAYTIDTSGILTLKSKYTSDDIANLSEQIKSKTDSILQNVNDGMSDYEKSLYFYEYITKNVSYSDEALDNSENMPWASSLVGPFTMGRCTCLGYAKAYQYLLQLSKINCAVVYGKAETPQGKSAHAWVIQECDGACYYTDPTWGDCFEQSGNEDYISHSYFCVDENEIEKTHTVENKDILPKCTANADNYFVKSKLLFSSYSRSDVKTAVKNSIESGNYYVELKYTSENAYNEAVKKLFDEGQIYYILTAASIKDKNINFEKTKYSENKALHIITIFFN